MIIREYRPEDLESIVRIEEKAFTVGPYNIHMLREILHHPDSFSLVCTENNEIIGYAVAIPLDEKIADVESIAVDPAYSGKGIGKSLMIGLEQWMIKNEFQFSVLEVREFNVEAIGLYIKLGYIQSEFLRNYYEFEFKGSRNGFRMIKNLRSK
ncbi:MAG: GNAT family N-acetyltransferase [Thermoplasmataceae archaeon]